ncbi:MAG: DNA helicase II [Chromatiaceae bacterium]|nr:DNA helicase II [Chromatiaceae bacterium]MCP5422785.1 DNA helicase II [Chromatiaceae bacterium]
MDVSHIIDDLNEAQRAAVTAPLGSALVLAGAGSGKTRVLVHRIAWLIQVEGLSPWGILAVTFTNKAAREMKHRIEHLLGQPVGGMWVGTFHGLAHRLLRAHWQEAGLPQGFQIMDSDDQQRLVKRIIRDMNLDDAKWPPRQAQWYINKQKDEGLRADHLDHGGDPYQRQMIAIYREYEAACQRAGTVDFAELLLRAHELWRDRSDVLQHYRERFGAILVDEFQDTNAIQYAWLRLLAGQDDKLFVVGDDDQSIYGWRGARVENIQDFQAHHPNATVVRLEQNYRSTGNILNAANAVIANNPTRLGKQLWTADGDGEPIRVYGAFNEVDEARFVVDRIAAAVAHGMRRSECAILYRTTAQSRLFEEALIQAGMPYRVYGGLRFFERAEIKDALAYLRLVSNRHDDPSFERAVNQPPRGIGPRTLDAVRAHARDFGCSLWQAAGDLLRGGAMAARAANALRGFLELVDGIDADSDGQELVTRAESVIDASKLKEHFDKSRDGKGQDRIENLDELVNACRQFEMPGDEDGADSGLSEMDAFLAHAALEAGDTQADEYEDCVQLMTLHSAKGLEFPLVFIGGVEEGLFPHSMSADDPQRLEEERRLCYVGMTRAMAQLYLSHAESRRLHGSESYPMASRFLREIPAELIEEVRARPNVSRPYTPGRGSLSSAQEETGLHLGQRVLHPKFGEGVVLNAEGQGNGARVQVNFEDVGSKWLVVAYANLTPA